MAVNIANVQTQSDTFQVWVDKTNAALDVITRLAVTTESNTSGGQTTGNAHVNGFFSANLLATTTLRGGNVVAAGNLTITSNASFTGANLHSAANVFLNTSNVFANALAFTITGGTANLHSNVIINGNTLIISSNNFTVNSEVNYMLIQTANVTYAPVAGGKFAIQSDFVLDGTSANISSNVSFTGNVEFTKSLYISGDGTFDGDVKLGSTPSSIVTIPGSVNTSITPFANDTYNIGSPSRYWNSVYVTNLNAGSITFTGSLTDIIDLSANSVTINNTTTQIAIVNTNIGSANVAGVFTTVPIFSFNKEQYRSAKIVATTYSLNDNNHTTSEMMIIHDGTTPTMTVYATIASNTTANVGDYTVDIDTGDVRLLHTQKTGSGNTAIKLYAFLTKPF